MVAWARLNGFEPALHHRYIIDRLERVAAGQLRRLIILVPPGAAKSTYTSVLFPPWYLAGKEGRSILACSYAKDLAASFGRRCRNLVDLHSNVLRYELRKDSKAADEWETSLNGRYFCAGVGSGIAGHRADLGFIDDYLGSQEDADSKPTREKQWGWYWGDFWPRLKPEAAVVIIANRRHEDDLVGRLLAKEGANWEVVCLPMLAESDNDPLGRKVGDRLWPEWFTEEMVSTAQSVPRIWAGLYQQRPAPEQGDYFKKEWFIGYQAHELPKNLRVYAAGDFAISEEDGANHTCFGGAGLDEQGILWILPDIYWDYLRPDPPDKKISGILDLCDIIKPEITWAEKGHISKSLRPFITREMVERKQFYYIDEVTPTADKEARAQSIRAMFSRGVVRVPIFAPWWAAAQHELLVFPGGRTDDFVDFLGHLGRGVSMMSKPRLASAPPPGGFPTISPPLTIEWIKQSSRRRELALAAENDDL
jgi:hypothetical protein